MTSSYNSFPFPSHWSKLKVVDSIPNRPYGAKDQKLSLASRIHPLETLVQSFHLFNPPSRNQLKLLLLGFLLQEETACEDDSERSDPFPPNERTLIHSNDGNEIGSGKHGGGGGGWEYVVLGDNEIRWALHPMMHRSCGRISVRVPESHLWARCAC